MPEDIACEAKLPSEPDSEQGQSDDGADAPGSQDVPGFCGSGGRSVGAASSIAAHPAMARIVERSGSKEANASRAGGTQQVAAYSLPTLVVRSSSLTRNLFLLASVALVAALTLTPIRGDDVVEVSELGDVLEAFSESDTQFLLGFSLEAAANILLFVPLGAALSLRGLSLVETATYGFVLSTAVGARNGS